MINILLETWKGDSSDIKIPNYYSLSKCRARKKRARRNSGGIIVYIKTELKRDIECIENISKSHNRICLKLKKTFFGLDQDLYLCGIYNHIMLYRVHLA